MLRPLTASLILGLVWGFGHVALYWQRPIFLLLFFASILAGSVVLTWLFINAGRSVLLCTLFHAVFNTWTLVLLTTPFHQGSEGLFAVNMVLLWIAVGILVARYSAELSHAPVAYPEATGSG